MNNEEIKNEKPKKRRISFAVLYVGSALAFLVVLLIGFSLLLKIYLPESEEDKSPEYGRVNGLQELATDFAVRDDWAEQGNQRRV